MQSDREGHWKRVNAIPSPYTQALPSMSTTFHLRGYSTFSERDSCGALGKWAKGRSAARYDTDT